MNSSNIYCTSLNSYTKTRTYYYSLYVLYAVQVFMYSACFKPQPYHLTIRRDSDSLFNNNSFNNVMLCLYVS
jgi:hypothetical protein